MLFFYFEFYCNIYCLFLVTKEFGEVFKPLIGNNKIK